MKYTIGQQHELLRTHISRRTLFKGAALGAGALAVTRAGLGSPKGALAGTSVGPSTTVEPYFIPSMNGVDITSILTVKDMPAKNGYRMVGIPDGLGLMPAGGRNFTVLMNHELGSGAGIARDHGSIGAFVSKWTIDKKTFEVLAGDDLAQKVYQWDVPTTSYVQQTTAWNRLCSADLPDPKALRHGNRGTDERIFLNGEEFDGGRAFGHIVTGANAGDSWELPRLGKLPYENVLACPNGKAKTIVIGLEDGDLSTSPATAQPCELWVYVGEKQTSGNPIERAGLTNGKLYGAKVYRNGTLVTEETDPFGLGDAGTGYVSMGRFELIEIGPDGDVSGMTAVALRNEAVANDLTRFQRIEDGHWDPRGSREEDFYFCTTGSFTTRTRLWRLRFDDIDNPLAGGTIEIIINGAANGVGGPDIRMIDNLCVDGLGRVLMCEDVGGNARLGKIWAYGTDSGQLVEVAAANPKFFNNAPPGPFFHTIDEEASGIVDAQQILGQGWFIFDVQDHSSAGDVELVQNGQLLAMYVHPSIAR